ncbi:MAG TPA: hypothetical protein VLZ75_10365 [Chitinophagales bacterium]|nr:hypothetical protein [Chitinophagales bacterium]
MLKKIQSFFSIDIEKLRATQQGLPLFIDILMIILVIINLNLIFFDWSYSFSSFQALVEFISPTFDHFYATEIHPNTSYLDLIFVSIFITELIIRWSIAIYRKRYNKWFFYPFIHWYDVLGCIPMNGTLKLFRLFRVVGMTIRLNNLGIINLKSTYVYRKASKYIEIVAEEITDKVVSNVIKGAQAEVQKDSPLVQKIALKVFEPKKEQINEWLNASISQMLTVVYFKHRNDLNQYLKSIVTKSVQENLEIQRISMIPGIGKQIKEALDSSISNITFNVIDNSIEDIAKTRNIPAINDITNYIIQQLEVDQSTNKELSELMKGIIVDTLEMVKTHVEIKLWKINELSLKKVKLLKRLENDRGNTSAIKAKIEIIEKEILELQNPEKN